MVINMINESSTSMIRRTRSDKLTTLAANMAIRIAKDRQDPLYKKYKRFRDLFWTAKKMLVKRYGARGMMVARKAMLKSNK